MCELENVKKEVENGCVQVDKDGLIVSFKMSPKLQRSMKKSISKYEKLMSKWHKTTMKAIQRAYEN
jgi:membrane peptidoglycan carboxypeptidase